ncbi:hypothetical protein PG996_002621 [Apiospora saccharicola]|uniref:Uncharacterized protein n=1 Tax=Apiospora saccharicola TaxID=335842 RepID=A0ABR1WMY9_9PEZI
MQVFSTNCTLPSSGVAFVAAPHIRGTLSIVWSCVLVLVACTWSVLHLNVPPQSTIEPGNWTQKFRRTAARTWTKVKWMLFTLLAPEYALGKAFSDFHLVRCLKPQFEELSRSDGVPWSAAHTHFANMGGFVIKFAPRVNTTSDHRDQHTNEMGFRDQSVFNLNNSVSAPTSVGDTRYTPDVVDNAIAQIQTLDTEMVWSREEQHRACIERIWKTFENDVWKINFWSPETFEQFATRHSWALGKTDWTVDKTNTATVDLALRTVDMSYFRNESEAIRFRMTYEYWARNISLLRSNLWILDANQLLLAREYGIIDKLPFLASDDLDDRNKQDLFLKLLALGQISWFMLEIFSRLYRGLSPSLLEVMVLAFALCTVIAYLLLLSKPNNATYSVTMSAARRPQTTHEAVRLALAGPAVPGWFRESPWIPNNAIHLEQHPPPSTNEPPRGIAGGPDPYVGYGRYTTYGSTACALVFGAVHCLA